MTSRALSHRGAGFTGEEDTILCKAYCLHSSKFAIGLYRNREAMWNEIESTYNKEACDQLKYKFRTLKGLQSRWYIIYGACKLFWECICVDMFEGARVSYMRRHPKNKTFTFYHVWDIVKAHEKWIEHPKPIQPHDSSSLVEGTDEVSDDDDEEDVNNQQQAYLEYQEKMKQQRADYWARANALLDIEKKMLEIEQQKLDMREQKFNKRIMDMDLNDLTPMKKMYFTNKKMEIVSKQSMVGAARNLNFNVGAGNERESAQHIRQNVIGNVCTYHLFYLFLLLHRWIIGSTAVYDPFHPLLTRVLVTPKISMNKLSVEW
ncbi:hypothetical protein AQUCO_00700909v1 [Aquilegia coerulea]|uniref:No apical meristem-associated C-terminal domain-containing protein n=1 Tax=Aquilegia coerulea TaxID=218851 RepID=A0A2G5EMB2_AQUCA|nr:hypothetical protein AQUCO_00700909v1 [Aquilegia coerulea]